MCDRAVQSLEVDTLYQCRQKQFSSAIPLERTAMLLRTDLRRMILQYDALMQQGCRILSREYTEWQFNSVASHS